MKKKKKSRYFVLCKNILQRTIESCSEKLTDLENLQKTPLMESYF